MKNQECKVRLEIVHINNFGIWVSDIVKHLNVKVFNLMSLTNENRSIKWHETCKCIYRLNKIICNNKQGWNKEKCICECKKLIDKEVCDKGFIWNASNCGSECAKACNISQYLDYSDCKCKKN